MDQVHEGSPRTWGPRFVVSRIFQGGRVILKTGVNMNVNLPLSLLSSSVCQLSSFSNSLVRISYDLPVIILAALFCTFLHLVVQVITAIFPN